MTARRRSAHGIFKARQNKPRALITSLPFVPGFQPTSTGLSSSSQLSTITTPLSPPGTSSAPTTTSSSTQATSTSSGTTQTSTSTSTSTSASASTSSSTSSTLSSTSTGTTLHAPTTPAQQPAYTQPSHASYTYVGLTSSSSSTPSPTSSSSSSSTGSMSIGTVVGIVAGGFFGFMFVLILGSYILRWYRRHSAERDFTDEYNEPTPEPIRTAADGRKDDVFGSQMSQRAPSPSFGGGAGLAGQGVMASRAMPPRGYGGGYGGYPNMDEEVISGAYSSQPQPQTPYNAEAYAPYVPYNAASGYQEAMRGYQGQRTFEQPINYGYAISEDPTPMRPALASPPPAPAPSTSPRPIPTPASPPRTTTSAALAAAHAAAATAHVPAPVPAPAPALQDGQRKSAMYTEDDAYAGF